MNNLHHLMAALGVVTISLAACGGGGAPTQAPRASAGTPSASIDQDTLCETKTWRLADKCKLGQKIVFLPESFGNEQLPVMFAALNCDLRYNVALTQGAVVCIFKPLKPDAPEAPVSAAASSATK